MFYVPIVSVDDSPIVIGTFPTSSSMAASYWFDLSQSLAEQTSLWSMERPLLLGLGIVGPIMTAPLGDGGGTYIITIGCIFNAFKQRQPYGRD